MYACTLHCHLGLPPLCVSQVSPSCDFMQSLIAQRPADSKQNKFELQPGCVVLLHVAVRAASLGVFSLRHMTQIEDHALFCVANYYNCNEKLQCA